MFLFTPVFCAGAKPTESLDVSTTTTTDSIGRRPSTAENATQNAREKTLEKTPERTPVRTPEKNARENAEKKKPENGKLQ